MSSDFERLLRDARKALPEPSEAVTRRARERAIAAVRRRRSLRRPAAAILAVALVGLGVGIGALIAPSGSAAPAVRGFGFLPERGWSVLQNGGDGTPARPAAAIAANVELSPGDDPDGLPLATLETLPPDGVVIVASFIARDDRAAYDKSFPARALPLDVRDAAPGIEFGVQVRPDRPLGQYQLKAAVNGHYVDVNIYFGTVRASPALFAAAQRQLDRLVVRPESALGPARAIRQGRPTAVGSAATTTATVIDRTLSCAATTDTIRKIAVSGESGFRDPTDQQRWEWPAGVNIRSRGYFVVYMNAGTLPDSRYRSLGINMARCKASTARVPLSARGLTGGVASQLRGSDAYECVVARRVLIRVRAVFRVPATFRVRRSFGEPISETSTPAREAQLAVRTLAGKPLAYASVSETGKATLYAAPGCVSD